MTAIQLDNALAKLELSQLAAARICGVHGRTVRRYIAGETIPEPFAKLIRLMVAGKVTAKDVNNA